MSRSQVMRRTLLATGTGLLAFVGCGDPNNHPVQGYAEGEFVYVASPLAGQLDSLAVQRGSQVRTGDPLFQVRLYRVLPVPEGRDGIKVREERAAIARLLPDFSLRESASGDVRTTMTSVSAPPGQITLADRWRLVLGVTGCNGAMSRRVASTLDQLYGSSARAGRGRKDDLSGRGGTEAPSPSARDWVNEVNGLFGKDVCEEVLGDAAAAGRAAVLEHLNPETARPSASL